MSVKKNLRIMYPACGYDFWNDGGFSGSLTLVEDAIFGQGRLSDCRAETLDIVYCDINPEISKHTIKRAVDRLLCTQPNVREPRYILESESILHFSQLPEDEGLQMGYPDQEWTRNTWAYELLAQHRNGAMIRFRYFSASYQQVMYYLYSTGWGLQSDDVILLGSNWRNYGEGGQNLRTIFEEPLRKIFHDSTKVVTAEGVDRVYSQGYWNA